MLSRDNLKTNGQKQPVLTPHQSLRDSFSSRRSLPLEGKAPIGRMRCLLAEPSEAGLYFKAKTDELREYYIREFRAAPVGRYDPYRLVIWEDAAQDIISEFQEEERFTEISEAP